MQWQIDSDGNFNHIGGLRHRYSRSTAWAVSGPLFQFSDTWQLVITTGTTVLTFLAVFLIQHSQNRDGRDPAQARRAYPLDQDARNRLIDLEHCSDEEMERLQKEFPREQTRRRSDAKADAQ